jgi:tetratricopeptide (TPR) repeat protein
MEKDKPEKIFVFAIFSSMGASQLFFGYVESYTLVYVAIFAYLLFCLGYLKHKNGLIPPMLAFLLAFSLHVLAITLLPSLLYLIFTERSKKTKIKTGVETKTKTETERGEDRWVKFFLSLGIVVLVGIGLFLLQNFNTEKQGLGYYLIYPLGQGESFYSIFSSSHLLDLINHQLLVSPVGWLILFTSVLVFWKKIDYKDSTFRFLIWLSVFSLAFAFFIDPKLGYPRDWDMLAFSSLGYTFLGGYIFLKSWREANMGDLRYIILCLLFTSLFSTAPWIYVNASERKSVERFEYLLDLDKGRMGSGRENLAMYYDSRGEWEKEIQQWEKGIAVSGNARYIINLGVIYYNQRKYDPALRELKRSLGIDSTFAFTHFYLGKIYARTKEYEEAIAEYRKAIKFGPDVTEYYDNLGALLAHLERYQEAIEVFQEGVRAAPKYPSIYRNLGYSYFNSGDLISAEKYLQLYLEYAPQAKDAAEVKQVLRDLSQKRLQAPKQ